ncbi:hypothetical protein FRUB_03491 [Fimbriiglobus ruber]|uniref:Transposase IS66 central domain-containing protein n=1 Tax=Fimbriiglobus ruber TaxID=1908690 RepID=A0A225DR69_9BACT|nr:hypothetical protein FRUB_03491 [Fimbriiglobus ruber]
MARSHRGHPRRRQNPSRASLAEGDRRVLPTHCGSRNRTYATHGRDHTTQGRSEETRVQQQAQQVKQALHSSIARWQEARFAEAFEDPRSADSRRGSGHAETVAARREVVASRCVRRAGSGDQNTQHAVLVGNLAGADGEWIRGELPAGIRGHFGPGLLGFVLQQHYAAHVPQSRLLEELRDYGVDISAGQVNNMLTENHAAFHAEKDALLPTALQVFTCLNVDDSGAPHQGRYGSCLCICNEFFTSFHSSDTKERSKFLDVLRCGRIDYVLNEHAWAYLTRQGLPAKIWPLLQAEVSTGDVGERPFVTRTFADVSAWNQHLDGLGIDNAKHRQTMTEAALLGSAIAHGLSPNLGLVSDGSAIYALFVHGLCWIHQERNLAKLTPCGREQCQAMEEVLTAVWQLYADLKAYRLAPTPSQAELLRARFDAIVGRTTIWPELNAALQRMAGKKADLLRVLDRPDLPLHTNTAERDFRDWATKRKISAGTRGELGKRCRDTFLSLKSTCKKLGVRFTSYLQDRILKAGELLPLSELVRQRAAGSATI